jgi:hypothetical protein
VLPHVHRSPTERRQGLVHSVIADTIGVDLAPPELGVGLGHDAMLGAPMPEAAVNEDGHPCTPDDHIRTAGQRRLMKAEPETEAVQSPAKGDLGPRVSRPHTTHEDRHGLAGGGRAVGHGTSLADRNKVGR